jgi:ABC-type lipoprotein export system ATPase subunit
MVIMFDDIVSRTKSIAMFVQDVEREEPTPPLPKAATIHGVQYRLNGVTALYGEDGSQGSVVLPDVVISPGVTIVRGASGSGKSTLLGVADGSVAYEGSVLVGECELRDWDISEYVVNGSQSFGSMEVSLQRLFGEGIDEEALAVALLCAAYPDADISRPLSELSGGQRRRAMLASVIYHTLTGGYENGVLFVDEPTNDLGPSEIKALIQGFRRLAQRMPTLTIVITTHEGRLVRLADQLIALTGEGGATVKYRNKYGKLVADVLAS